MPQEMLNCMVCVEKGSVLCITELITWSLGSPWVPVGSRRGEGEPKRERNQKKGQKKAFNKEGLCAVLSSLGQREGSALRRAAGRAPPTSPRGPAAADRTRGPPPLPYIPSLH